MATSNTPPSGGDKGQPGELTPEERDAFKQRADALGKRLEAAKGHGAEQSTADSPSGSNAAGGELMGAALRMSTELIGGIVVGSGLGWLIDKAMGTWPAFFVVFFLLGAAAGITNVVRAGTKMKTGASNPKAGPSVRDDDDDK